MDGGSGGLWPILLLLLAVVLVPTACLLWFMSAAVRNERIAVRQKLSDAYLPQFEATARRVNEHWQRKAAGLSDAAAGAPPAQAFGRLVLDGVCDSAVIYDLSGILRYPRNAEHGVGGPEPDTRRWAAARNLEFARADLAGAAAAYAGIARDSEDANIAARALQAQARCLTRAGQTEAAIEVLAGPAADPSAESLADLAYRDARDPQGRLIVPSAQLMALELMGDPAHPRHAETLERLVARLADYAEPALPPGQRRFLMRRLEEIVPDQPLPLAVAAEDLAAEYLATGPARPAFASLVRTSLDGLWALPSPDRTVVALLRQERIAAEVGSVVAAEMPLTEASVEVLVAGQGDAEPEPFLLVSAGEYLPDWHLALHLAGPDPFSAATNRQIAAYLWTGFLVMAFTALIAAVVGRHLLRQLRLTRLKNDFIATVSHELKTPLSSTRVLVDTLLAGNYRNQEQAAEYLQLIARENERLSRLIDNFLSFSRMERDRRAFELTDLEPAEIVAAAADVVRSRFESHDCRFDVDTAPDLPAVAGDRDALITVVLNLLDNAYKYSDNDRRITLRTYAADGHVCFEVQDNGIGMSKRATRRVFDRFYQVDSSLARSAEGCGLGLSIVKFIVDAHGGTVEARSEPGKGSTFTVRLPATGRASRPT